ncbi:MAG: cobalamin B12-binding domain-containing protein [Promethearchaeota archaeon]|nr:MAG: cobalamin B12-binding domain-containing protein [Candidatus Lokiarchaeota archaeon]
MKMQKKLKALTAKPGLDGHDRGVKIVNRIFMESGIEVIYIGNTMPEEIIRAGMDEDVDIIGLSILSSSYKVLIPEFLQLAEQNGLKGKMLLLGGIILPRDQKIYKEKGFAGVYGPGTNIHKVVDYIHQYFKDK